MKKKKKDKIWADCCRWTSKSNLIAEAIALKTEQKKKSLEMNELIKFE